MVSRDLQLVVELEICHYGGPIRKACDFFFFSKYKLALYNINK